MSVADQKIASMEDTQTQLLENANYVNSLVKHAALIPTVKLVLQEHLILMEMEIV
jgi:hypothetical protein